MQGDARVHRGFNLVWRGHAAACSTACGWGLARLVMGDLRDQVERRGFGAINEPVCSVGAVVVACARMIEVQEFNCRQLMNLTSQDIDAMACT